MKRFCLALLAFLTVIAGYAQRVKIEFFTPRVVHIVKSQNDNYAGKKSLVVTAQKEDVALQQRGSTISSGELSVKLDERTGCVMSTQLSGSFWAPRCQMKSMAPTTYQDKKARTQGV